MRGSRRRLVGAGVIVVVVVVVVTSRTRFRFGGDRVEAGNHALEAINYRICPFGEHWLLENTCPRNTAVKIHVVGCSCGTTN